MTKSMLARSILQFILILALIMIPSMGLAEEVLQARCIEDLLTPNAAVQRIEWARRCALTTNTGGPDSWLLSARAFDMSFNPAKDYREIDPNHAYSGIANDHNVNYYYGFCRYQSAPVYTVFQETSGPTAGFWKWSQTIQRARPFYPTFGTTLDFNTSIRLFPRPELPGDCGLYQRDPTTGQLSRWTGNFYVLAYCPG